MRLRYTLDGNADANVQRPGHTTIVVANLAAGVTSLTLAGAIDVLLRQPIHAEVPLKTLPQPEVPPQALKHLSPTATPQAQAAGKPGASCFPLGWRDQYNG